MKAPGAASESEALLHLRVALAFVACATEVVGRYRRVVAHLLAEKDVLILNEFESLAQNWIEWLFKTHFRKIVVDSKENGREAQPVA